MKVPGYFKPILIILILILSITGCTDGGNNSDTFDITGKVVDVMDEGIPQVTVKIEKDNGDTIVVKTDENGQFSKTDLKGEFEVTVAKEEYNFDNPSRTVSSSKNFKFKGKLEVKVSEKAQILDLDTESKIVEVNENEVIFEGFNSMINDLTKGDIIIADPIENIAPNGIFRKIEGKTTSGTQIIFTTSQATLEDVIKQGGFSQVKELKYEDVETQTLKQTDKKIQLQASPSPAHEFRISINKEVEIADGVTISGSLDFNLNLKLEGTFKYCILQGMRFEEIITQESGLNITYGKGIEIDKEQEIYEKTLPRVKFTIGPVPVWITPQFNLVVGVDGEVSTELTTEVTAVKEITAGFEYDTDEGFQKIFEQTNDYNWQEPTLEGSSNIHGYFGPKMEFDFYEVTGPTTGLYPYLDFIGEITTDLSYLDMGWDLKGGLQGQIGAQIEFMGIDAEASYNLDLLPRMIAEGVMLKTNTVGKGTVQKQPDQLLYYIPEWEGKDAEITITARPDTGYRFDHWETKNDNIGSENPYNIKIDKPTSITAVFNKVETLISKPVLLIPVNNKSGVKTNPLLKWEASTDPNEGSVVYDVYLGTESDPSSKVVSDLESNSYQVSGLKEGTTYYWKVIAKDGNGGIKESDIWQFTTIDKAELNPPNLIEPGAEKEPGEVIDILTPTLKWETVNNADKYAMAISEYPYGSENVIYNPQDLTGTSHIIAEGILEMGKKYCWNMRASIGGEWGPVSKTLYFQTSDEQITITGKALLEDENLNSGINIRIMLNGKSENTITTTSTDENGNYLLHVPPLMNEEDNYCIYGDKDYFESDSRFIREISSEVIGMEDLILHNQKYVKFEWVYQIDESRNFREGNLKEGTTILLSGVKNDSNRCGFIFSEKIITSPVADIYFSDNRENPYSFWANNGEGGVHLVGEVPLEDIKEALDKEAGFYQYYNNLNTDVKKNYSYIIKTKDGNHYAIIRVIDKGVCE